MDEQPIETTGKTTEETTKGKPKVPVKRIVLIAAVLCFGWWVWPTPWQQNIQMEDYPNARVNRFTGEPWVLDDFGWVPFRVIKKTKELENYLWQQGSKYRLTQREVSLVEAGRLKLKLKDNESLTDDEAEAVAKEYRSVVRLGQLLREEFPRDWHRVFHPYWVETMKRVDEKFGGDVELYREAKEKSFLGQ